jgi:hypothetical protein
MDKIMWLKVIREELAILDELAIGMIEDANLTMEEVELAITRSKIVVKEFEVLYKQLSVTPAVSAATISVQPDEKISTSPSLSEYFPASDKPSASEQPVEVDFSDTSDKSPLQVEIPSPVPLETHSTEVTVPEMKVFPISEEQNILNIEDIKEHQPQFKAVHLKSLREGLSLNDRYLFQRELFDNDKSRLDETVAALDRQENIKEAVEYLKANFKWIKSEASEKFVHLVKRRFS